MENILREAPNVYQAFRNITKELDNKSPIDLKTKELILIGMFTCQNAIKGVGTHVNNALNRGATKDEIISSILYAIPISGIPSVVLAVEKALEIIEKRNKEE